MFAYFLLKLALLKKNSSRFTVFKNENLTLFTLLDLYVIFYNNGFIIGQKLLFVDGFSVMDSLRKI